MHVRLLSVFNQTHRSVQKLGAWYSHHTGPWARMSSSWPATMGMQGSSGTTKSRQLQMQYPDAAAGHAQVLHAFIKWMSCTL